MCFIFPLAAVDRAYAYNNNNKIQNTSRGAFENCFLFFCFFFNKLRHVVLAVRISVAYFRVLPLLQCRLLPLHPAYLRVYLLGQCYYYTANGNFEAVCGCLPSAGRDFCYQSPRFPSVACRQHNEPQPNKVKFIKSTDEKA